MKTPYRTFEELVGPLQKVTLILPDKSRVEVSLTTKDSWRVDWSDGGMNKGVHVVCGEHEVALRMDLEVAQLFNPPVLEESRIA